MAACNEQTKVEVDGRHHTKETKDKMRESNLGQKRTEETKQRMSEAKTVYKGLPTYVKGCNDTVRGQYGYVVMGHPTLLKSSFTTSDKSKVHLMLQRATDYADGKDVEKLYGGNTGDERTKEHYDLCRETKERSAQLPEFIYETHEHKKGQHGYQVRKHSTLKDRAFTAKSLSMEQKLQNAKDYLAGKDVPKAQKGKKDVV